MLLIRKMVGRFCGFSMLALGLVLLNSCNQGARPKVGFLIHDVEGRWVSDLANFKQLYDELGVELLVKDAGGNEALQLQQTDELIGEGVKIIVVVAVNQNTAGGIVRKAHRSGIPVIGFDRMIKNARLDYFISYEYKRMGEMMSEYALGKTPIGNYVLLWGDASDGNAQLLRQGQEFVLSKRLGSENIRLVYRGFVEDWSYHNARQMMTEIVDCSDEPIDVVLASNDNIARAAREVLDSVGANKSLVITSETAVVEALQTIQNEKSDQGQFKTNTQMVELTVQMTRDILNRKKVTAVNQLVDNGKLKVRSVLVLPRYR